MDFTDFFSHGIQEIIIISDLDIYERTTTQRHY
jgi:hypothetical protein